MSKELWKKITALVEEYNTRLAPYGLKCTVNRRFTTEKVQNRTVGGDNVYEIAEEAIYKNKERKYKNAPNTYKIAWLQVCPTENGIVPKNDRKQYAFVIGGKRRAHIGASPESIMVEEEKLLKRLRKRLEKILAKAKESDDASWCRNSAFDVLRYAVSSKYNSTVKTAKGKGMPFWKSLFAISLCILITAVALLAVYGRYIDKQAWFYIAVFSAAGLAFLLSYLYVRYIKSLKQQIRTDGFVLALMMAVWLFTGLYVSVALTILLYAMSAASAALIRLAWTKISKDTEGGIHTIECKLGYALLQMSLLALYIATLVP